MTFNFGFPKRCITSSYANYVTAEYAKLPLVIELKTRVSDIAAIFTDITSSLERTPPQTPLHFLVFEDLVWRAGVCGRGGVA